MQPYLTPDRLRTMKTGASLSGYSDLELADLIAEASAIVDAFCNLPLTPKPGSLRGGVVVGEQHRWDYSLYGWDQGTRRVFPFNTPIRSVQQLRLLVAAGAVAEIPSNTLVINNTERWVEVTALAIASNSGLFGVTGWIVPIGGLNNPMAELDYTYGNILDETDERAYPIATGEKRIFQVGHGFWVVDDDHTPTVTADGTLVDDSDYTLDPEVGRVTFNADQTGVVRVTYSHELDRNVPSATAYVCAHLSGVSKGRERGLGAGVNKIRVGEITIDRSMSAKEAGSLLEQAVPEAALLLTGHRIIWVS